MRYRQVLTHCQLRQTLFSLDSLHFVKRLYLLVGKVWILAAILLSRIDQASVSVQLPQEPVSALCHIQHCIYTLPGAYAHHGKV